MTPEPIAWRRWRHAIGRPAPDTSEGTRTIPIWTVDKLDFFLQQSVNGLALAGVYALFALGFSLVLANLGVFHVAHEGVFTWGAVGAWWLMNHWDIPIAPTVVLIVVFTGLMNVVAYLTLFRHLENRKNAELAGFISSLGGLIVLTALADQLVNRTSVRLPFDALKPVVWEVNGISISNIQVLITGLAVVVFLILVWFIDRTRTGRAVRAVAFDRQLAALLGVNPTRISAVVFFISGALAGLAAVLVALAFNVINAYIGATYLVVAIAVTVIGGFGSIKGVVAGAVLMGLASAYTTGYVTSSFKDVVVFGLLIGFLIVRPSGLFKVPTAGARA